MLHSLSKKIVSLALIVGLTASIFGCGKTTVEGEEGKSLTLLSPANQSIMQGETNKVLITITRDKFNDKVDIDVSDLPSGISLADGSRAVAANENTVTLTLVAARDAKPVKDHRVKVTASGPGDLEVSEFFKLTVTEKKPS